MTKRLRRSKTTGVSDEEMCLVKHSNEGASMAELVVQKTMCDEEVYLMQLSNERASMAEHVVQKKRCQSRVVIL